MTTIDALYTNLRIDPTMDDADRLVMSDLLWDAGFTEEQVEAFRAGKIPLAPLDKWAVTLLASCRFAPGTFAKKFAASMDSPHADIVSPKQFRVLWSLVWNYRKQISRKTGDLGTGKIQQVLDMLRLVHRKRAKVEMDLPVHNDSTGRAEKVMNIAPAFQGHEHLVGE